MKLSEIFRYQAERIIEAAQAARDARAVDITERLLSALPCSENLVASYAAQIQRECRAQAVGVLAEELASATIPGDARYRLEDMAMASAA